MPSPLPPYVKRRIRGSSLQSVKKIQEHATFVKIDKTTYKSQNTNELLPL
jgi:hypothetical protein